MALLKTTPVKEPKKKNVRDVIASLESERKLSGLTLSDSQLEFIVKLVKACQ